MIPDFLVEGQSGFLSEERDVAAMAAHMTFLFEHPEVWPEMGRIGRRHVDENYNIVRLVERLAGIYESLVAQNRAAVGVGR